MPYTAHVMHIGKALRRFKFNSSFTFPATSLPFILIFMELCAIRRTFETAESLRDYLSNFGVRSTVRPLNMRAKYSTPSLSRIMPNLHIFASSYSI